MIEIVGRIKVSNEKAYVSFSDDFCSLYLWFIKKEYPWFNRILFTPRYKSHLTLFIQKTHDVKNLNYLKSLNNKKVTVYVDERNLVHNKTFLGAEIFLFPVDCKNIWDIINKSGIQHKHKSNRPHITICSSKHGNLI